VLFYYIYLIVSQYNIILKIEKERTVKHVHHDIRMFNGSVGSGLIHIGADMGNNVEEQECV